MNRIIILTLSFLFLSVTAFGQISRADLGINGLTCSLCARSVERALLELDFIESVEMNLQQTQGTIIFKNDVPVHPDQIAEKVVDAGFSVRYLKMDIDLKKFRQISGGCYEINGRTFVLLVKPQPSAKSAITVRMIGEEFLPRKEFKKWDSKLNDPCKNADSPSEAPYFITI